DVDLGAVLDGVDRVAAGADGLVVDMRRDDEHAVSSPCCFEEGIDRRLTIRANRLQQCHGDGGCKYERHGVGDRSNLIIGSGRGLGNFAVLRSNSLMNSRLKTLLWQQFGAAID